MRDLHAATLEFLHGQLKAKQLDLARAEDLDDRMASQLQFNALLQRICLEFSYFPEAAEGASDSPHDP